MFRHRFMLTYSQNDARGILQASIFHELISEICLIVPRTTKKGTLPVCNTDLKFHTVLTEIYLLKWSD